MTLFDPDEEPAGVPFRTVLASIVSLWLFYFIMTTLRGSLLGMDYQAEMIAPRFLVSAAGVAITVVLYLLMRPFDRRSFGVRISVALIGALPASVILAQINGLAFASIENRMIEKVDDGSGVRILRDESGNILVDVPDMPVADASPGRDDTSASAAADRDKPPVRVVGTGYRSKAKLERWQEITDIALARYFLLVAWAALYQALLAGEGARSAERREGEYRRAAKAAELRSLRYQVNPHFLFNTLNSLSALVLTGKGDKAEEMIQNLSRFYRRSLNEDPTADIPLAEEFAQQRLYVDMKRCGSPSRLRAVFDLPADLARCCVPGMILQPLVENSVKYAVAPTTRTVTITISARREGRILALTVSDDGAGDASQEATPQVEPQPGHGIGLVNVRERLHARFAENAGILTGRTVRGYSTTIRLPWSEHDCI